MTQPRDMPKRELAKILLHDGGQDAASQIATTLPPPRAGCRE